MESHIFPISRCSIVLVGVGGVEKNEILVECTAMNPYNFRNICDVQRYLQPSSNVEAFAIFPSGSRTILALACGSDLLFLSPSDDDAMDDDYAIRKFSWPPNRRQESIACMAFSHCGRWLTCVLTNGSIEIVPTALALPSTHGRDVAHGSLQLFPTDDLSYIELRIRDDCLGLPTCAIWYETKQKRHMLIYSNKGGDILFIDLTIRRLSVSLQAPQSIHNLEVVEDAAHNDVYLLVSGFAGTQWLVPLEQQGMTLRETLARIVPSELKELNIRGLVTAVRSGGCNYLGVVHEDTFKMFNTTNFTTPVMHLLLPESTFAVRYTDVLTFVAHKQVFVSYSFNCCSTVDYAVETREEFTSIMGQLPDCRLLGFFALQSDGQTQLPSCLFITESSIYLAEPKWTAREYLANLLLSDKKLTLIELYCQAVGLNFQTSCFDAIPALLERKAVERALQICSLSRAPMYAIAKQFVERGFAAFILPQISSWLLGTPHKASSANEQAKRDLSQLGFELHLETYKNSEGFEKSKAEQNFKNFLLHNIWYDPDYCLKTLLKHRMHDCALAVVKVHGLYESLAKEIITMDEWDEADDAFLALISVAGLSAILLDPRSTYCNHYMARLEKLFSKITRRQRVRFLALFDPEREEMTRLLELVDSPRKMDGGMTALSAKSLVEDVVRFFLSSLIDYIYSDSGFDEHSNVAKESASVTTSNTRSADIIPVACGAEHACVLSSDGLLYAFGRSRHGCLGERVDSSTVTSSPVPIIFSPAKIEVAQIACGNDYTICLAKCGSVFSWGSNKYGQLGIGRELVQSNKAMYVSAFGENAEITKIESGQYHNFALDANGSPWGWGWNVHRQVGVGNRVDDIFLPSRLECFNDVAIKSISCGYAHTIFLDETGRLYGCGNNAYGQLALDDVKKVSSPRRLRIASRFDPRLVGAMEHDEFELIATGYFHNVALSKGKRLFTWGATPQSLKFKALLQKRKHQQIIAASGSNNRATTSVVSTTEATTAGVANGLVDAKHLRPSTVDLLDIDANKIVQLACGFHHSLLRTNDGRLYTWGKNFEFQLGHSDKKERSTPTLVTSIFQPVAYAACGSDSTIVVDVNRLFWGWGKNDSCQLGFESLASSEKHSLAGRVLTIQRPNKAGQRTIVLPQDSRAYVSKPVRIAGLRSLWPLESDNETEEKFVRKYSQGFLFNVLRKVRNFYNLQDMIDACNRYEAEGVAAFIHLLNEDSESSLRMALDKLINSKLVEGDQIEEILTFYTDLAENCKLATSNASSLLLVIFAYSEFYKRHSFDLNAFMERHLAFWAPAITTLLTENPKVVPLDFKLRLQAAQLVRRSSPKAGTTLLKGERMEKTDSYSDASQQELISAGSTGDRYSYLFSCGHVVAEGAVKSSLSNVANHELIAQRAPRLVESVQRYAQNVEDLPFDMCPVCLTANLGKIFHTALV